MLTLPQPRVVSTYFTGIETHSKAEAGPPGQPELPLHMDHGREGQPQVLGDQERAPALLSEPRNLAPPRRQPPGRMVGLGGLTSLTPQSLARWQCIGVSNSRHIFRQTYDIREVEARLAI
jgi:hypothetical protein